MEEENLAASRPKNGHFWLYVAILAILVLIAGGIWYFLTQSKNKEAESPVQGGQSSVVEPKDNAGQYNWSQMSEGPYRDRVSFATGTSLTSWQDSQIILSEHASVPDVILKDGTLYVYFVDVSEDGKPEQVGLLKSSDNGKNWSEKQIVTIKDLGNKVAVDPAPYLLDDGRIRLYYFDISKTRVEGTSNNSIYSAVSSDGVNFTEESGVRFKYPAIYDPDVIKVGDAWRMYVGTEDQKVLSATSQDGLTFTYEGVAYSGSSIPNVIYEDGTYYLFTGGIEIATSKDGKTFTKTSSRFDSGGLTADPGVAKLADGSFFMVYKTKEGAAPKPNPQ